MRICASVSVRLLSCKVVRISSVVFSRSSASTRILRTWSNSNAWKWLRLPVVVRMGDLPFSTQYIRGELQNSSIQSTLVSPLFRGHIWKQYVSAQGMKHFNDEFFWTQEKLGRI